VLTLAIAVTHLRWFIAWFLLKSTLSFLVRALVCIFLLLFLLGLSFKLQWPIVICDCVFVKNIYLSTEKYIGSEQCLY
jgi:hypothetical protein